MHLALYRGDETIVSALVQHGADPSLIDGYGRSAMDWAQLDEVLFRKIAVCLQEYLETSRAIQIHQLKQSIYTLPQSLLEAGQKDVSPGFYELGHCLMFLHKYDDARIAFRHQIVRDDEGRPIYNVFCNICKGEITGLRFVCQTCPDQELCELCMQHYAKDTTTRCCRGHTFLQIPGPEWNDSEVKESSEKGTNEWLKALTEQHTTNGQHDELAE